MMTDLFRKLGNRWNTAFPPRRRWRLLRASLRLATLSIVLAVTTMLLRTGPHGLAGFPFTDYFAAFASLLWLWTALALPFVVRWLDHRLRRAASLFQKELGAFAVALLVPGAYLAVVAGGVYFLVRTADFKLTEHWQLLLGLGLGHASLTLFALLTTAKHLSDRMEDSLRVLVNGMNMASHLDFDHPITTVERDEIGRISEAFNSMTHVIRTKVNLLHALFDNMRVFSGFLNTDRILEHAPRTFKSVEEGAEVVLALLDETDGKLVVAKTSQPRPELLGLRFGPGEGVLGKVLDEKQFLVFSDADYTKLAGECEGERLLWGKPHFTAAVPMLYKGNLKGAIALYNIDAENFQFEANMDYFQGLANQIAIFLENAKLYGMVIHDRLTGLYVHSYIESELSSLIARAKTGKFPVSFVMFDVDKFKQINDRHGHAVGNQVLSAVSSIVRKVSRDTDLPARFGGDEFEIILPHADKTGALIYAEKIRKAVEDLEVKLSEDVAVHTSISVGVATYPQDGETVSQLQIAADKALYGAKEKGRNAVVGYGSAPAEIDRRGRNGH